MILKISVSQKREKLDSEKSVQSAECRQLFLEPQIALDRVIGLVHYLDNIFCQESDHFQGSLNKGGNPFT